MMISPWGRGSIFMLNILSVGRSGGTLGSRMITISNNSQYICACAGLDMAYEE